jgi:hypothetical protein
MLIELSDGAVLVIFVVVTALIALGGFAIGLVYSRSSPRRTWLVSLLGPLAYLFPGTKRGEDSKRSSGE